MEGDGFDCCVDSDEFADEGAELDRVRTGKRKGGRDLELVAVYGPLIEAQ